MFLATLSANDFKELFMLEVVEEPTTLAAFYTSITRHTRPFEQIDGRLKVSTSGADVILAAIIRWLMTEPTTT